MSLLLSCGTAAITAAAHAWAEPPEPVRLRYDAPPECPGSDVLAEQMLARSPRLRMAGPAELARVFEITITPDAQQYRGGVRARDENGADLDISVTGSCPEVVSTLSLVAAMTVDPAAMTTLPVPFMLPENPYWGELARLEQDRGTHVEGMLRENPYRGPALVGDDHPHPNPYPAALTDASDPFLRANPYR
jgi:hypothetical protein